MGNKLIESLLFTDGQIKDLLVPDARIFVRKSALSILERAAERINRGWCQDSYAVIEDGGRVSTGRVSSDPRACQWCLMGAIGEDVPDDDRRVSLAKDWVRNALRTVVGEWGLLNWNDARGRTKEEVLAAIDGATTMARIALAGEGAP